MNYFKSINSIKLRGRCRNFTLVELLVVLAIVGIIIGIALPAFEKLAVGSGVDAAATMVSSQLRLARDYAITKRQKVAVIMPTNNTGMVPDNMYACFRPAIVTGSASTFTFVSWVENTKWTFLPKGAAIMEADGDAGIQRAGTYELNPNNDTEDVAITTFTHFSAGTDLAPVGNSSGDYRCVVFNPTGRLLSANDDSTYVTIGEAVYTGSSWIIRNPSTLGLNRSSSNQVTIKIDPYTGRTVMFTPEEYGAAGTL